MIIVVVGIIAGIAVVSGPLGFLGGPVARATASLMDYGTAAADYLLRLLSTLLETSSLAQFAGPLIGIVVPGFVVLGLAAATKAADKVKRFVASLALVLGALSFFVLDTGSAVVVFVLAALFAGITAVTGGALVKLPLVILGTSMSISFVTMLLDGSNSLIAGAVATYASAGPGSDPAIWEVVFTATGVMPFVAAAWLLLRD